MVNKFISRLLRWGGVAIASTIGVIPASFVAADTSSVDYIFLVDNNQPSCQQIGAEYQEIRAFETANFHINICQKENNYYYLGEAKKGAINTIFLPANGLAPGEMYRAHNGNLAYIVTILPNEAFLTIERNGAQVAVESSLEKQCINSEALSQIPGEIASQMYYSLSDLRILPEHSYLNMSQIGTVNLNTLYNVNSLAKYDLEAILSLQICE